MSQHTNVTIKSETLKIDLYAEYAAVEVHFNAHAVAAFRD
jgi:hypothetical protein